MAKEVPTRVLSIPFSPSQPHPALIRAHLSRLFPPPRPADLEAVDIG